MSFEGAHKSGLFSFFQSRESMRACQYENHHFEGVVCLTRVFDNLILMRWRMGPEVKDNQYEGLLQV